MKKQGGKAMEAAHLTDILLSTTNTYQISSVLGELTSDDVVDLATTILPNGHTLLHLLVQREKLQALRELLVRGVGCLARNAQGATPLHTALQHNCLMAARLLIEEGGAKVSEVISRRKGTTLLHQMVACDRPQAVRLLLDNKVEVNVRDREGRTPFHLAAVYGNCAVAALLLRHEQCDVNAYDETGHSALMLAIINNNHEVTKVLLDSPRVDVIQRDLHKDRSPLHLAVAQGQLDVVRILLRRNSANLHSKEKSMGRAPIHLACALVCSPSGEVTSNCLLNNNHYEQLAALLSMNAAQEDPAGQEEDADISRDMENLLHRKTVTASRLLAWIEEKENQNVDFTMQFKERQSPLPSQSHSQTSLSTKSDSQTSLSTKGDSQTSLSTKSDSQTPFSTKSDSQTSLSTRSGSWTPFSTMSDSQTLLLTKSDSQTSFLTKSDSHTLLSTKSDSQTSFATKSNRHTLHLTKSDRQTLLSTKNDSQTPFSRQRKIQTRQSEEDVVVNGHQPSSSTTFCKTHSSLAPVTSDLINGNVVLEPTSKPPAGNFPRAGTPRKQPTSKQQDTKYHRVTSPSPLSLKKRLKTSDIPSSSSRLRTRHSISGEAIHRSPRPQQSPPTTSGPQKPCGTTVGKKGIMVRPSTAPARNRHRSSSSVSFAEPEQTVSAPSTSRVEISPVHNGTGPAVTPLTIGAIRCRMVSLLLEHGADANLMTSFRKSPLHIAAIMGTADIMAVLLPHVTNINVLSAHNKTALHLAVERNHVTVADQLIQGGANLGLRDVAGMTALHVAARLGLTHIAVLLLRARAPIDCTDFKQMSPVHHACLHNHPEVVDILISAGARLDVVDVAGFKPLDYRKHCKPCTPRISVDNNNSHRTEPSTPSSTSSILMLDSPRADRSEKLKLKVSYSLEVPQPALNFQRPGLVFSGTSLQKAA